MSEKPTLDDSGSRESTETAARTAEQWLVDLSTESRARLGTLWHASQSARGSFAADFYGALFTASPPVAELFPGDPESQQGMLVETLGEAVRLCAQPQQLVLLLRAAGVRHHHYRVKQDYFALMEHALMDTLHNRLGAGFSDDDEALFRNWFHNAALVMRHAMAGAGHG